MAMWPDQSEPVKELGKSHQRGGLVCCCGTLVFPLNPWASTLAVPVQLVLCGEPESSFSSVICSC